jgi:hypothetical protein
VLLDAAHDGAGISATVHSNIAPHSSARITNEGGVCQLTDRLHDRHVWVHYDEGSF